MKLLALFYIFLAIPLFGRIGETLAQCRVRYGVETNQQGSEYIFLKSGFTVSCAFDGTTSDAKVISILFVKMSGGETPHPIAISDDEINLFLKANASGSTWRQADKNNSIGAQWVSTDSRLLAVYDASKRTLMIVSSEFLKKLQDQKMAEKAEILKGF